MLQLYVQSVAIARGPSSTDVKKRLEKEPRKAQYRKTTISYKTTFNCLSRFIFLNFVTTLFSDFCHHFARNTNLLSPTRYGIDRAKSIIERQQKISKAKHSNRDKVTKCQVIIKETCLTWNTAGQDDRHDTYTDFVLKPGEVTFSGRISLSGPTKSLTTTRNMKKLSTTQENPTSFTKSNIA